MANEQVGLLMLPPTLFQELENVELMLMTKTDRVGRNLSYTLGDPDQTIVYTIVEEKLSTCICEDRRLPLKLKMMYEGKEVMKLDRVRALETCFTIC
ncbi:hypothetical protein MSG28_011393 [Choristoneura fumiferana]|uniref:Uncharacterized protein n=1 Tax=Choristoneura fumiferana TaxID=7141 RepID=A0ACC0JN61_CHOFU|nr:hypothetical protein MSG28_011393 [Choristoneura fumiferana]